MSFCFFDFLFDRTLSFDALRRDDYSFHMNCSYSHELSDEQLQTTLDSLVARGLLHQKTGPFYRIETRTYYNRALYTMTPAAVDFGNAKDFLIESLSMYRTVGPRCLRSRNASCNML